MKNYIISLKEILSVRDFSEKEKAVITKAYNFAKDKHKGQKFDGYPYPYFLHPAYAGYLLANWGRDYEEITAGLLHDVVEDCDVKLSTIRKTFGRRVAFLVDGMSWEIRWDKKTKSWYKDRPGFYQKIMDYSRKDIAVTIIHAADEMSKLGDIAKKKFVRKDENPEKTKKRYMWNATIMIPFYREVGLKKVSQNVFNKIKDYIPKLPPSKLSDYITKSQLKVLRNKLSQIKDIENLK